MYVCMLHPVHALQSIQIHFFFIGWYDSIWNRCDSYSAFFNRSLSHTDIMIQKHARCSWIGRSVFAFEKKKQTNERRKKNYDFSCESFNAIKFTWTRALHFSFRQMHPTAQSPENREQWELSNYFIDSHDIQIELHRFQTHLNTVYDFITCFRCKSRPTN